MRLRRPNHRAFTLVELLVVIGIVTILVGIITSAVMTARQSALRTQCASNLRQVGLAIQAYAIDNAGEIPAVYGLRQQHGRPMGWCNFGMSKDGIGNSGFLLLVNQPAGLVTRGCLPDTSLFRCPGDYITPGHRAAFSYAYAYVPQGGGSYVPWYFQPPSIPAPSSYHWVDGLLAGLERHSLRLNNNAASTAIMIEGTAIHRDGGPWIKFHGKGGNILCLDGHVIFTALEAPALGQQEDYRSTFIAADRAVAAD